MDEKERQKLIIPSWCPLCQRVMKGSKSNETYFRWGVCSDCHIAFVEGREERWTGGWRPSSDQVDVYYEKVHS